MSAKFEWNKLNDIFQIVGLLLNESHFICSSCSTPHELFGSPTSFRATAQRYGVDILGELPLVPGVSRGGDHGVPYALYSPDNNNGVIDSGGKEWKDTMANLASTVWQFLLK